MTAVQLSTGPAPLPLSTTPTRVASASRQAPASRQAAVRLTRRGRVAVLLAFLVVIAVAMTVLGGLATASRESGTPEPVRIVEVQPGDTLFGLAGDSAEPGGVQEMVHRIQQLNSLPSASITVGQKLAIPTN